MTLRLLDVMVRAKGEYDGSLVAWHLFKLPEAFWGNVEFAKLNLFHRDEPLTPAMKAFVAAERERRAKRASHAGGE